MTWISPYSRYFHLLRWHFRSVIFLKYKIIKPVSRYIFTCSFCSAYSKGLFLGTSKNDLHLQDHFKVHMSSNRFNGLWIRNNRLLFLYLRYPHLLRYDFTPVLILWCWTYSEYSSMHLLLQKANQHYMYHLLTVTGLMYFFFTTVL